MTSNVSVNDFLLKCSFVKQDPREPPVNLAQVVQTDLLAQVVLLAHSVTLAQLELLVHLEQLDRVETLEMWVHRALVDQLVPLEQMEIQELMDHQVCQKAKYNRILNTRYLYCVCRLHGCVLTFALLIFAFRSKWSNWFTWRHRSHRRNWAIWA